MWENFNKYTVDWDKGTITFHEVYDWKDIVCVIKEKIPCSKGVIVCYDIHESSLPGGPREIGCNNVRCYSHEGQEIWAAKNSLESRNSGPFSIKQEDDKITINNGEHHCFLNPENGELYDCTRIYDGVRFVPRNT